MKWLADAIGRLLFIGVLMWVATLFGWEAPTPENIRKLDMELEAAAAAEAKGN